jgi:hypothetical protein
MLSMVLVLSLLPALLSLFDKQIQKQQERSIKRKERRRLKYTNVRGKLKGGDANE